MFYSIYGICIWQEDENSSSYVFSCSYNEGTRLFQQNGQSLELDELYDTFSSSVARLYWQRFLRHSSAKCIMAQQEYR